MPGNTTLIGKLVLDHTAIDFPRGLKFHFFSWIRCHLGNKTGKHTASVDPSDSLPPAQCRGLIFGGFLNEKTG